MPINQLTGLIIARYGHQVDVEMANGQIERIYLTRTLGDVVTGDHVLLEKQAHQLTIIGYQPRASVLTKHLAHGKSKAIAANIDQLLLVIAPQPTPTLALIDDYLVMAEALKIKPIIAFNKSDLLTREERKLWEEKLSIYEKLSYPVLFTSSLKQHDLLPLTKVLQQKTSIFIGQSGVGKSSIIQQLIPDLEIRIGALSQSQHGKHTTTTTRLYHLSCGGNLIDSPGVRSFALWPMTASQIANYFVEFTPHLKYCRFQNCHHRTEPNCAILDALEHGEIALTRYNSYQRLSLIKS